MAETLVLFVTSVGLSGHFFKWVGIQQVGVFVYSDIEAPVSGVFTTMASYLFNLFCKRKNFHL